MIANRYSFRELLYSAVVGVGCKTAPNMSDSEGCASLGPAPARGSPRVPVTAEEGTQAARKRQEHHE